MNPSKVFDIDLHICIKEAEFTPADPNDRMSTDELFVVEATCNGQKMYDNDRYSVSEMVKALEFVRQKLNEDAEEAAAAEADWRYHSLVEAKWGAA